MILLHCSIFLSLRFDRGPKKNRSALRDIFFVLEVLLVLVFLLLVFSWQSFGLLFSMEKNPIPYFILSFLPSGLFLLIARLLRAWDMKQPRGQDAE
jgi:uncharacterized BrkB/YihY/UPF0761 family membrane protein